MSIIWDWAEHPYAELGQHHVEGTCALSGEPLDPPFMLWVGPEVITINAKSLSRHGAGFELDIAILAYAGKSMNDGKELGRIRQLFVNRMKAAE